MENNTKTINDKTVVTFFVNIGNLEDKDIKAYMRKMKKEISLSEYEDAVTFFIPTRGESAIQIDRPNK